MLKNANYKIFIFDEQLFATDSPVILSLYVMFYILHVKLKILKMQNTTF